MQWYFASLLLLFVLVGGGLLMGSLVLAWLPWRVQPAARVFLGVPLGWALLTLVATVFGWFGPGYASCHPTWISLLLIVAGAWTGRHSLRRAGGDCARLAAFVLLASFPPLGPLWRVGNFSLYNDTYLYHGQAIWLQHHRFADTANTAGGHPLAGTVVLMQHDHLRMGAAFLLGWVQAAFSMDLPHCLFPVVAALGVICGALGAGATVLACCPRRWVEAWFTALAVALTVNGFPFGAANGFLPQTWGLAFGAAAFGLRGLEIAAGGDRPGRGRWRVGVPIGILAAASMHCYWDLLPIEAPALACSYLPGWPAGNLAAWKSRLNAALVPLLTCVLLVNLEWGRAVLGILHNIHARTANPVAWSLWEFPAHALGLKSSVWERGRWLTGDSPPVMLTLGCAVVAAAAALTWYGAGARSRDRWGRLPFVGPACRLRPLVPLLVWLGLSTGLILYFRYVVVSPWAKDPDPTWPDGVGQSWSQYKVTIWGNLCAIVTVSTGLTAAIARLRSQRARLALWGGFVLWCGTGLGWNYRIAHRRGEELTHDTGTTRDPFIPCLAMRQKLASVPPDAWIYLDWPADGQGDKFRELMVSLLPAHRVASRWSSGKSIVDYVTPEDARRGMADCAWVLRYRPPGGNGLDDPGAVGGMTLTARP